MLPILSTNVVHIFFLCIYNHLKKQEHKKGLLHLWFAYAKFCVSAVNHIIKQLWNKSAELQGHVYLRGDLNWKCAYL